MIVERLQLLAQRLGSEQPSALLPPVLSRTGFAARLL